MQLGALIEKADFRTLALAVSVFGLTLALWLGVLWIWAQRRMARQKIIRERLQGTRAPVSEARTLRLWVDANPKETDLTYVRPGQVATVTVDAFPAKQWVGRVEAISPGTGAQFSILPPQNAAGNWIKVFREHANERIQLRAERIIKE